MNRGDIMNPTVLKILVAVSAKSGQEKIAKNIMLPKGVKTK